jgi:hypothetical protein
VSEGSDKQTGDGPETDADAAAKRDLPSWSRRRKKFKEAPAGVIQLEDDAFQRGVKRAGAAAVSSAQWVVIGLVVAIAATAAGVYGWSARQAHLADSTRLLEQAVAMRARGRITIIAPTDDTPEPTAGSAEEQRSKTAAALDELEGHGGSASLNAGLVRGAMALEAGEFAAAKTAYEGFLAKAAIDHPLRHLAVEGKGLALEGEGDLEGALAVMGELAGQPGVFYRDQALRQQGRLLEALGRTDEAITAYKTYVEEFPPPRGGIGLPFVTARLEELDPSVLASLTKPDVEVIDMPAPASAAPTAADEGPAADGAGGE